MWGHPLVQFRSKAGHGWRTALRGEYPTSRNYALFSFLSDVRGRPATEGGYVPNAGLPADMDSDGELSLSLVASAMTEDGHLMDVRDHEGYRYPVWLGDHSWGYGTLREMLSMPWGEYLHYHEVWLTDKEYREWKASGEIHPGGAWKPCYLHEGDGKKVYEYSFCAKDESGFYLFLKELAMWNDLDDTRILIGYDG